jgi:hypothetical protein
LNWWWLVFPQLSWAMVACVFLLILLFLSFGFGKAILLKKPSFGERLTSGVVVDRVFGRIL